MTATTSEPHRGRLAYTLSEAAEATGLSEKTLTRAIKAGELNAGRTSEAGRYTITRAALTAWLTATPEPREETA